MYFYANSASQHCLITYSLIREALVHIIFSEFSKTNLMLIHPNCLEIVYMQTKIRADYILPRMFAMYLYVYSASSLENSDFHPQARIT